MIPEPTCAMCGEEYCLRDGCEPTKYCDICAHIAAEAAERELSEARDRIEAFADAIECYYAEKTLACQRAAAAERDRDELRAESERLKSEIVGHKKANDLLLKGMESQAELMDGMKQELRTKK